MIVLPSLCSHQHFLIYWDDISYVWGRRKRRRAKHLIWCGKSTDRFHFLEKKLYEIHVSFLPQECLKTFPLRKICQIRFASIEARAGKVMFSSHPDLTLNITAISISVILRPSPIRVTGVQLCAAPGNGLHFLSVGAGSQISDERSSPLSSFSLPSAPCYDTRDLLCVCQVSGVSGVCWKQWGSMQVLSSICFPFPQHLLISVVSLESLSEELSLS